MGGFSIGARSLTYGGILLTFGGVIINKCDDFGDQAARQGKARHIDLLLNHPATEEMMMMLNGTEEQKRGMW